jgi:hypothetical protein
MAEFEKGWRVLVHLPGRADVQQGIVGDSGKRKLDKRRATWVWVDIEGKLLLVPEKDLEAKIDEPYYLEIVKEFQQASLVLKAGRERIITPTAEKGYLRSHNGCDWWYKGKPVVSKLKEKALNDAYKRLALQASAVSAGV